MGPDVTAVYRSPAAPLAGREAATAIRRAIQAGPICIIPRQIDGGVAALIDAMPPDHLPRFDVSGSLTRVRKDIAAAMTRTEACPEELARWLREDCLGLVDLYRMLAGCESGRARLQVVADDMCQEFHVDNVAFRLVTTYRGPGTQWITPTTLTPGVPLTPEAIRCLDRGAVAVMRGGRAATPERPGLLHRSPPIAGSGTTRLFLAIDEAGT